MNFDSLPKSTKQRTIEPYLLPVSEMFTGELNKINLDTILPYTSSKLPSLSQNPAHDHTSTAQSSRKPRVVSDSAINSDQFHNNFVLTPQELPHGLRYQRTPSVGCQPHGSTWIVDTGFGDFPPFAPENSTEIPLGEGETLEDYLRAFGDPPNNEFEPRYDGTKPTAYIQVNNPQSYLPTPVPRAPGSHSHRTPSSRRQSTIETHSNLDWTYPQPGGQSLSAGEVIRSQQPTSTSHDRNQYQSPSRAPAPSPYSQVNVQIATSSNPSSEHHQSLFTQPEVALGDKAEEQYLNNYHLTESYRGISTQIDPKKQSSDPRAPNRSRNGSKVSRTNEVALYTTNAPVQSTLQTQSMPTHMVAQRSDLSGSNYALRIPHTLQNQELAPDPRSVDYIPVIALNTVVHGEGEPAPCPEPPLHNPGHPSLGHAPPNYCQTSTSNHPPHLVTPTWPQNPPIPVAGTDPQSTPAVVAPAPRRSLDLGAFLTPDPPCQTSNLDLLPPRPGTSPPQRISAPNGRSRLLPNTGRRQSKQTRQSYTSQFDQAQLPPTPSHHAGNTSHLEANYTHRSQISAVSRRQAWVQGQPRCEDNRAVANYGPAPVRTSNGRALTNVCTSRPPIQRQVTTGNQESQDVWNPSQLQHSTPAAPTHHGEQLGQQRRTAQQNQSSTGQRSQKRSIQIQRELMTQGRDVQERTNQQAQALSFKVSMQVTPQMAERHNSDRQVTVKRRHSQSNPGNTDMTKKRKVEDPEPTSFNTQLDTLVPPSQCQQQNSSVAGSDCVYFDVNTWRGDDIANRDVRKSESTESDTQNQPWDGDGRFMSSSSSEPTGATTNNKSSKDVSPSSKPSQASYGGGTAPPMVPTALESWLPGPHYIGQGEGASSLQYMNWDLSVNIPDQILGFEAEATTESRILEQYATALNQLERPAPEVPAPIFPWVSGMPNNREVDNFPTTCYNWDVPSVVA